MFLVRGGQISLTLSNYYDHLITFHACHWRWHHACTVMSRSLVVLIRSGPGCDWISLETVFWHRGPLSLLSDVESLLSMWLQSIISDFPNASTSLTSHGSYLIISVSVIISLLLAEGTAHADMPGNLNQTLLWGTVLEMSHVHSSSLESQCSGVVIKLGMRK